MSKRIDPKDVNPYETRKVRPKEQKKRPNPEDVNPYDVRAVRRGSKN